jgi:hypothetical protein
MLKGSLAIHMAKQDCIEDMICNVNFGDWDGDECRFTLYRVITECPPFHKSLADPKIARRHLDAQVELGILDVDESKGKREYIYRRKM